MLSIDAQRNELREYARKESLPIAREFVESMTAKEPGRPIFNEMLRLVEQGEADALLAWHPDRLALSSVDGGRIIYRHGSRTSSSEERFLKRFRCGSNSTFRSFGVGFR